ncbi:MAG TPA: protein kinase [Steroidobacteraceae bacterium]|nr:protein kinase [Steroidobacteraceae bacterium]
MTEDLTSKRWLRMKALFAATVEAPAAERFELLVRGAQGDSALIAEVQSLLAAHDQPGEFLDGPPAELKAQAFAVANDDARVGERIGAYRIVGTLGTGGMGDVFRAVRDDDQYRAEVAIKLMRADVRDTLAQQRFKTERQILARLDHRNIAHLLDGGATPHGVPYVVMELVQGEPVDQYCDARNLPVRERVRLFLQVCSAVSYAHQHLVVHRDLKPNNILVTTDGSVKLLDFGIAKLLESNPITGATSDETLTQLRAMTLDYASPEQISGGAVTTVSDVYSLGVVLYRLLTGQSPYGKGPNDAQRVAEILSDTAPPRPSQVRPNDQRARDIDADLDNILLMALRKEPQKRYGSVEQLANDLRNFLGGLPVSARGNVWRYRFGKFVRRRKVEIAAAGIVIASLVGGLGFAIHEARVAEQQRAIAQRHFDSVRTLASTLVSDLYDEVVDLPGAMKARTRILETGQRYLDELAKESGDDRKLQEELAVAYRKLADLQGGQNGNSTGDSKSALESYRKSIALLESVVAAEPGNQSARVALAKSLILEARLLLFTKGPDAALALAQRSVTLSETAREGYSSDFDRTNTLVVSYWTLGDILLGLKKTDQGMAAYAKMVAVSEEFSTEHPDHVDGLKLLRNGYGNAATAVDPRLTPEESFARMSDLTRKSIAVSEALLAKDPASPEHLTRLAEIRFNYADALRTAGDPQTSIPLYRLAAPQLAKAAEDKTDARAQLAKALNDTGLAEALVRSGDTKEAFALYDDAGRALDALLQRDADNLFTHYAVAQLDIYRGAMYAQLARQSSSRGAQLDYWRKAEASLDQGVARMTKVNEQYPLSGAEKFAMDFGIETLANAKAAIASRAH